MGRGRTGASGERFAPIGVGRNGPIGVPRGLSARSGRGHWPAAVGPLRVGVLNTVDGDTAAVAVTVTGGNLLEIANASNLDQDSVTLTADKIKVGAGVTAASAVVKPTGAQSIDLGAGTDTGFALDSAELGNFTVPLRQPCNSAISR